LCFLGGKNSRIVSSEGSCTQNGTNQFRVVKCPHHTENMREKKTKNVSGKNRQREKEEEEYVESMRKEDTSQHEEEVDKRSIRK
jgi:hypothetical protein